VSDVDALKTARGDLTLIGRAISWDELQPGLDYWIITPHGAVRARFKDRHVEPIEYTKSLNDVRHFELARFLLPDKATFGGDSGSPVVTDPTGGTLIAMHIAGDGERFSVAIPAWQLLHPALYRNDLAGEIWTLWPRPEG
jgi:hypothetical protein